MPNHSYFKKKQLCFLLKFSFLFVINSSFLDANCQVAKSSFQLSFSAEVTPKATIKKTEGEFNIKSTHQPTIEAGLDYRRNVYESLFIITGLRGTLWRWNAIFPAPVKEINPAYSESFPLLKFNELNFGISVPLLIEKNWQFKDNNAAYLQTGLKLNYSFGYNVDRYGNILFDTNQQAINVFSMDLNSNNQNKPWLSCSLGTGYGWSLKNRNYLRAGIFANFSFSKIVNGTYQVYVPGHAITKGTYKTTGTYLAFTINYGFTGTNKNVLSERENNEYSRIEKKEVKKNNETGDVFNRNHLSFNLSLFYSTRAKVNPLKVNNSLSSSAMPGASLGIIYHSNFNDKFSINAGIEATLNGRNFDLQLKKEEFTPQLEQDCLLKGKKTYVGDMIFNLPVTLERRHFLSKTKYINCEAGIRLNYSFGADFDDQEVIVANTDGANLKVAEIETYANNDRKPWISFPLRVGYGCILKNHNIAMISLSTNLSPSKYVNGTYKIIIPGKPDSGGTYSVTSSYFGLMFSYIFTNSKNRL